MDKEGPPPPAKRPRRSVDLPENANPDLFSVFQDDDSDYEDFNAISFHKPIA